jgi:UDP-N-acetylglucosamine diphosphorylase/glucosamine-1-phosphate N-acetyltransferase
MNDAMAVVLAAGMGTRMRTELPKVLCPALGRPMIEFVLDALQSAGVKRIVVVVGYRADDVRSTLRHYKNLEFVDQTERLGTGHAVKMAYSQIKSSTGPVVVVAGDSPMIQPESVRRLLSDFSATKPACLMGTLHKANPTGLGRIVRDAKGNFAAIVEEKDATDEQRKITEVNMSTYVFSAPDLAWSLDHLKNENRQKEYYLTDAPGLLLAEGKTVQALPILQECESLSINTVDELVLVEAKMREMGYDKARR